MPGLDPLPGIAAPAPQELELRPAKISDRFIAYLFDTVPFAAGYAGTVWHLFAQLGRSLPWAELRRLGLAWAGAYLLYQLVGNATGGTLGKRLLGLRVVRTDGQPLGFVGAVMRTVGYALSTPFFNAGFVLALFHPESRALHDLLSGSLVIEPRARSAAESSVLFLGALCLAAGVFGGTVLLTVASPTPADKAAVARARDGVLVLAQIEEAAKAKGGSYTKSVDELAQASGDPAKFRAAMRELFDPELIQIEAGSKAYRITVAAKDRGASRVRLEGPPPVFVP
jgi:uncharacterized RDD family membrane protein YckC